jgi:hypothetical protein
VEADVKMSAVVAMVKALPAVHGRHFDLREQRPLSVDLEGAVQNVRLSWCVGAWVPVVHLRSAADANPTLAMHRGEAAAAMVAVGSEVEQNKHCRDPQGRRIRQTPVGEHQYQPSF